MAIVSFCSEKHSIRVRIGEKDVIFQNGVLNLDSDNEEQAAQIVEMRRKLADPDYAGMAQLIRELPVENAERIAKEHQKLHNVQHRLATGGLDSMSQDLQASATGATRAALDDTMHANGATQEQIDQAAAQLAKDGLVLVENADKGNPFRQPREGFTPLKTAAEVSADGAEGGDTNTGGEGENAPEAGTEGTATIKLPNPTTMTAPGAFGKRTGFTPLKS